MPNRSTLTADLLGHPLVLDAAVLSRQAVDGTVHRVAYVVPTPAADPAQVRRAVTATALTGTGSDEPALLVTTVSAIPRTTDGHPDEAALHRLAVPESVDPQPVPVPAPRPRRLHLGDVIDLPTPWVAGPLPTVEVGAVDLDGPSSLCGGRPLEQRPGDPTTLVDALLSTAWSAPDSGVHVVEAEGTRLLKYPDLLKAARRTLTGLRAAGLDAGDPVILHTPSLAEHVVGLWACLLGGIQPVAVAQAPGYDARNGVLDKLENTWRDLDRPVVLSGGATVAALTEYAAGAGIDGLRVVDLAQCANSAPAKNLHQPTGDDIALLQLSSGSTGKSKVIQLTHRGLIRYVQAARLVSHMRTGDTFVNWLPLDHVAGLVMYHIGPVVLGCDNVQVPTSHVLGDPLRWFDLVHRFRAQHSWAPNFGFQLVADALADRPRRDWDLRCLRTLINAGEQCTEPVMSRFVEALRPYGVSERTVRLAWGMAETCTAITYQHFGKAAIQHVRQPAPGQRLDLVGSSGPGVTTFLSMGPPAPGSQFRIAGPDGQTVLPELHIGRLQGRSDRITPGYRNNPTANNEAFPDADWFDTGDLAFVADGRVTITGRAKEVIIVNGVHYYCHEIEDVLGTLDGVAAGFVAAFGVPVPDGSERLAVVFVPDGPLTAATVRGVRRCVGERFGLPSVLLAAVDQSSFDRTTSGKIKRGGMRARLLGGELVRESRAVELAEAGPATMPDCVYTPQWRPRRFPSAGLPERVLVITDRPELARSLPGALLVTAGTELSEVDNRFRLDLGDPAQWRELLARLRASGRTPSHIVLGSSYLDLPALSDEAALARMVDACSTELLVLLDALAAEGWAGELVTLSRGLHRITGTERACYPAALTEAIGETAALERPELRVWHLDLPGSQRDPAVLADALTWRHRESVVAWRKMPMVRGLRRTTLRAGGSSALTRGSCWLVTGGNGGIGRTVLAGLGLRLLVVGRSPAPADLGKDVRYAQVDIADGAALEAAVVEAEQAWGTRLTGVLHLASQYELAPLADTPVERWRAQASSKVEGSLQVARVLSRRPGSRLVAFSSLLSTLPVVGASTYVAGNRFLEALCAHLAPRTLVHCLSWGMWRGIGLNAGAGDAEAAVRGRMLALSPAEGRALFTAAVHQPPGTLLLGVEPAGPPARSLLLPARALEGLPAPTKDVFGTDVPVGPPVRSQPAPPPTPTPAPVAAVVGADPLGVARAVREAVRAVLPAGVPADLPFYEAGIGSVQLMRLHTVLQTALGREFPVTTLFSHPTEAALVGHLTELLEPPRERPEPRAGQDRRIAIIGMAARFPGANTLDRYWANLLAATVSTRRYDRAELLAAGLPESLVDDPDYVPVSGALDDDIAGFDAELFGISPGEAERTDPQQRLFLQICHEALEHGGYAGTSGRVGVYAGSGMQLYSLRTYLREQLGAVDPGDQLDALRVAIGNEPDFLATRVAYKLGLTGPAMAVRTACSTSLVAVHLAVQALLSGEAELALAGAAALHVPQAAGYRYQDGSILSRTGECRAFDATADGTVGGNGVAAVLLKPLDRALADGDTVHAVILGSAVNNDGSAKVGYTSPSVSGQVGVIRDAFAAGAVDPATVGYVEAHGTGTALGDPIEVEALREVFGDRADPVLVGSVKPNIGHLDSCAGMAGLIKAALAVRHGVVPPLAGLREPNPALRLGDGPIELPAQAREWPVSGPRRAGVSALGVGGTNAHVVLEQPPAQPESVPAAVSIVPLSARGATALGELADRMADALESTSDISGADVLTTLGAGRRRLPHRLVAWGDTTEDTARALRAGGSVSGVAGASGPLVFAFTGQGVDCTGAAAELMAYPAAAETLRRCTEHHRRTWGVDLLEPLLGGPHEWTTATVQPALLALQLAQVALLESVGIRADAVIGHSVGEYAALCVAGALSPEDAMHLAAARGTLMQSVAEGAMLAVFGDPTEVLSAVPELELAVRNGSDNVVLAGPPATVAAAEDVLRRGDVEHRRLAVDRAFHTAAMEPVLDELARQAATVTWRPLRLAVTTGVGGATLAPGTVLGPDHVRDHTRARADYAAGVDHLTAQGCTTFLELGPAAVLTGFGRQWPDTTWIPVRRTGTDSPVPALAAVFCRGVDVDWAALAEGGRRVPLPTYPFQLTRHWASAEPVATPVPPAEAPVPDPDTGEVVLARVRAVTAQLLGERPERITPDVPFFDLGADSLLMINMVRELEVAFGVRVAMRELFEDADTPARLSATIVERMAPVAPAPVVVETIPLPTASPNDAVLREQLDLMDRLARLMAEQRAALTGTPPPPPAVRPRPAQQLGPRAAIPRGAGMTAGRMDERQQAHLAALVERYTRKTATSKEIAQRYRRPLADSRAVVGFRSATKELLYPIAASKARGAYLEDVDGNTYVDITMGFGALMFGHEPQFLTDAVNAHLADGMRLGPRGEEAGQAAELLCELTGMDRAAFATSGTEANSGAFRLARAYTGRTMIVTFDGSYHGHFDPVLGRSVPADEGLRTVPVSAGIPDSAVSETLVLGYGDEASLDTIRRHADRVAAVVLEAVPSRYPERQPVEFVRALRELCDQYGIVLMFDEMLTGFRPHPQGAQGIFGVRADLATYGKVIGGGYPIGAIAGRADIMDWIDGGHWRYGDDSMPMGETTFFGGTYIQHPVSMVAARAVLTHLRDQGPGLQRGLTAKTDRLTSTLNEFFADEEFPVSVQQFGSLFRFAHRGNLELLFNHLVLEGVHVWEWRNFFLSTAHTEADVDFVVDAVRNSLTDLRAGGFLPGATTPSPSPRRALPGIAAAPVRAALPEPVATEVGATTPDFSLYFFGDYPRERGGDKYGAIIEATRFADRAGLHAVWLPERHFDSFGGVFPNPSVLAAALASQTSRIRLHAGCVVLPLHDPIRVAEEWSVVDNLSGGRVGIGVASGWHARDFVLAPEVYGRHREVMYEGVDTVRALWRGESVRRTAGNGEDVEVALFPRPVQDQPPFYTAIVGNPESYRQAAAADIGVVTNLMSQSVDDLAANIALYRRTRAEHGLDPAAGRVVVLLHTYLGADTARARAEAFGPFCDYLRSSLSLFGQVTNSLGFTIDLANTPKDDVDFLLSRAYERYCADRALIGSPADCEPIVARLSELGVDEIACFVDFGPTPEQIMTGLPGIDQLRAAFTEAPAESEQDSRPLTPVQHQIWYVDQVFPDRPTYTESQVVLLEGELDVPALRQALTTVVNRHDNLRSVFRAVDGVPRQFVAVTAAVELPVLDDPGASVEEAARRAARKETDTGFDLATGPLFDPRLIRLDDRKHLLVLRMHHLVVDTWSAEILGEEIAACYRARLAGTEPTLPAPGPLPEHRPGGSPHLDHWVSRLTDAPDLVVPTDRPRPAAPTKRGATVGLTLDPELTFRVKELARRSRVTVFMVLFAAFATVLRRLSGQTDLVIGTPVADRPDGTERTVGFLVNTLPVRVRVPDDTTFTALVRQARGLLLDAQENGDVPFPEIVRALGGTRDPLRNPLFEVAVEFDNEAVFELDLPGVRSTLLDVAVDRAPLDLTLFLTNLGERIRCRLNYSVDLFDAATPQRVLDQLRHVLDAVSAEPDRPLGELTEPAAESDLLDQWQDGGPPPPPLARLLHTGLSDVDGVAIVDDQGELRRRELHRRVARLTSTLRARGVDGLHPVAVLLPRSADAVVAMLAVLRTGAAFLPLDPDQPPARLSAILGQANVAAVITHSTLAGTLPPDLSTVLVDRVPDGPNLECLAPTPRDMAYVLFTSGSTGTPKGCVIEHRAITTMITWLIKDLGITAQDRISWFSSPGFDASWLEVWPALHTGASLHVVPANLRLDPEGLRDWLIRTGITIAVVPTPVCELLLDLDWPAAEDVALRHLLTGGDRLRRRPPEGLGFPVWNTYGPTETTVVATWGVVPAHGDGPPTIGKPVPGTWVRVLDERGQPAPIGTPGELYIGGVQVGRGYLGEPDETAHRFVRHPEYGRMFRTGDVVRWRADGELDFLHRNDAQVQIRGNRVEPGEIEHHLRGVAGVREAAVRGWTDASGAAYLAAYVVPSVAGLTVEKLRSELSALLPEYLVPSAWTLLDALPTHTSGKLDRAALPEPSATRPDRAAPPAAPLEERLHDIWCAELGLRSAGVESTFFELGGHSLTAVRLLSRVRAELGRTLDVLEFLRAPTIRAMATRLASGAADSRARFGPGQGNVVTTVNDDVGDLLMLLAAKDVRLTSDGVALHYDAPEGTLSDHLLDVLRRFKPELVRRLSTPDTRVERTAPASACQARQYRFTKASDAPWMLTIAQRFELRGSLDRTALRSALTALVARHPALRTRYRAFGSEVLQEVLTPGPVSLPVVSVAAADLDATVRTWAGRPFDLDAEPAFRVVLFSVAPDRAEFVLAMHHGLGDGWSMTVLVRDLAELYRAMATGTEPDLPALDADYLDFTRWEQEHLRDPLTRTVLRNWVAEVGAVREIPVLPTDRPRPQRLSGTGDVWTLTLPAELADEVTAFAAKHHSTRYSVLFAVFTLLLHELTGAPTAVATCGVANRVDPRFDDVVGVFTHTSWLVVPVRGARTFAGLLARATTAVWQRLALQSVPADVIDPALGAPFDQGSPRVFFSMFDERPPVLALPGLAPATACDIALAGARVDQSWELGATEDGGLALHVEYSVDLFDRATVVRWGERFTHLLRRALADPDLPVAVPVWPAEENLD